MPDLLPNIPEPWLLLQHPHVRALAFAIGSAPLVQDWPNPCHTLMIPPIELPNDVFWQQHLQRYWPRLLQLDDNPRPLQHALNLRPNTRLGHYFEDLLAFWLGDEGWHEFVLIGHGIQRMDGRRTLGELDFLLENLDTGDIEHWEICVKFYLGEGSLKAADWVGLQRQDTLGRKLHHLQHQQFAVRRIQGFTIDRRRAVVKGRLFWPAVPTADQPVHHTGMAWLNPTHLQGEWQQYLPKPAPTGQHWRRAERLEWLAEHRHDHTRSWASPAYWSSGLYLRQDAQDSTQQRLMLRLETRFTQPPHRSNSLPSYAYGCTTNPR